MAKPIPEGFHTLTPYLRVRNGEAAIAFYQKAFGAELTEKLPGHDGKGVGHAALKIGDSMLMLSDEYPQMGIVSPQTLGGTASAVHIYVNDVDAAVARAVAAGAKVTLPVMDMFWGDRFAKLIDPFGHDWSIATHKEDLTPQQIRERSGEAMRKMGAEMGKGKPGAGGTSGWPK
jgi:PhnB protein